MNATCRGNISKSLSIKSSAVPPLMTIVNQAFRHCRCSIFSGLSYKLQHEPITPGYIEANYRFLNNFIKNVV